MPIAARGDKDFMGFFIKSLYSGTRFGIASLRSPLHNKTMEFFFAGMIAGILIERVRLGGHDTAAFPSFHISLPAVSAPDLFFVGLVLGLFALLSLAVRALSRD